MTRKSTHLKSYLWIGIHTSGKSVRGKILAQNSAVANVLLYKQGITVRYIYINRLACLSFNHRRITSKLITDLTQQLETLLNAGFPLTDALYTLQKGQTHKPLYDLLNTLQETIKAGHPFSLALKKYPHLFNPLFCNLIKLGEQSGELNSVLSLLLRHRQELDLLQKKIKKALAYPLTVLSISMLITASLLIFVVPQFESLFKSFHAELPPLTNTMITLSHHIRTHALHIILGLLFSFYALRFGYQFDIRFRLYLDSYALMIPYVGGIIRKTAIARFSKTLAMSLNAGLTLTEALSAVSDITGNKAYQNSILKIKEHVLCGGSLHSAMEACHLFPSALSHMIAVGEEAGRLDPMLHQISEQYQRLLNDTVSSLEHILEPCLMVLLGTLIGGLIIAMYLPIFQLGTIIS